jgi:beta-phosphoglucomutase-like phosphatase (HAD superfamily)
VTADIVKIGKPSPEGYLLGRERLGVSDESHPVVVFEDAPAGVVAGKAAGATVIGVLETHSRDALEAAGAGHIVDGLTKVTVSPGTNGKFLLHF